MDEKKVCCVCFHELSIHFDEESGWRCQNLGIKKPEGIETVEAKDLEKIGVDTIKELARRNIDNLYQKLKTYWERIIKIPEINRPSRAELNKWIELAKFLQPILNY